MPVRKYGSFFAALLLVVLFAEYFYSIHQQSFTWDEGNHLPAGYRSLTERDFGINPEHPPLVKALAAVPLLFMHLPAHPSTRPDAFFKDAAYLDGRDFLFAQGAERAQRILLCARLAASLLALLLGVLLYRAAREMFGVEVALLALALLVFEPNIVAHSAYVTTDMGLACFLFASVYALYRYVKAPSPGRVVVLGLAAGLALASKHSAILLLPIAVALILTEILWPAEGVSRRALAARLSGAFAAASALAITVLWAFYGFRFAARPAGLSLHPAYAEYVQGLKGFEPRLFRALAHWRLLPESYLYGLADVRMVSNFFPAYIFGQVHAHGVWYYFPAAFLIKSTAAFLVLLVLAVFAIASGKLRARREIFFLALPALLYLCIATASGLNIGARHILPMYAFLSVLLAAGAVALVRSHRAWAWVVGVLLLWHVVSTVRTLPDTVAYSNEFWGGANNTYKVLTDSNTDWAQQLIAVRGYLDQRGAGDCWFAYFAQPVIDFRAYGIPCRELPTADTMWSHYPVDVPPTVQGTVLISAGDLTGFEFGSNLLNPYREFQQKTPVAFIRHGVFVYEGSFDLRAASALGRVTRASKLAGEHHPEEALAEARLAVQTDADFIPAQMALGDAAAELGERQEAEQAYQKALVLVAAMEPGARAEWQANLEGKLAKLAGEARR